MAQIERILELKAEIEREEEKQCYSKLGFLAEEVNRILRDDLIPWDVMEDTMPGVIDAVENSVFRHSLYELLCHFFKAAIKEGADLKEFLHEAELLLRLHIVLIDMRESYLCTGEIMEALTGLMSPETLKDIVDRPDPGHLRLDPVEYTRHWEQIYYGVEEKLERLFANRPRKKGFCFKYWSSKHDILLSEYGIDWRSPSHMNPRVRFD